MATKTYVSITSTATFLRSVFLGENGTYDRWYQQIRTRKNVGQRPGTRNYLASKT
jgi:hypothetical protein